MREIGRLREVAFRAVGEGTFKRRDIDEYDSHYFHLVLWDQHDLEIVGAYRFADAEQLTQADHPTGLYSSTLFNYSDSNQDLFAHGLELGRSFVQPKYWGKRSLDYLWFGIGAFLSRYPKYLRCVSQTC
jgi:putative hemolysin